MMDTITNCTADVTIESENGGHAIGGLCAVSYTHLDVYKRQAQDPTAYGEDWGKPGSICELLDKLNKVPGLEWIRIMYAYPERITDVYKRQDDYMTKPFSVSELLARVEALCRRVTRNKEEDSNGNTPLGTLTSGEFVLDENRRVLLKAGQPIELTQVEFQIMEDRKSTRLNSSHITRSRMPSSA